MIIKADLITDIQRVAKQYQHQFSNSDNYCTRDYYDQHGQINYRRFFSTWAEAKEEAINYDNEYEPILKSNTKISQEASGPNLNIVSTSAEIRTLEQLIQYCQIDLDKWKVTKHVVNSWGSESNENFQVKAWLTEKDPEKDPYQLVKEIIKTAKDYAPNYKPIQYKQLPEEGNLLEISLYDQHFGQLSWRDETGYSNYDLKISEILAEDAIDNLLSKASHLCINKILVVIGNDFFNVNNSESTTYAGTFQSEDDRWQKTFAKGWKLWVKLLEKMMQVAPVDVLVITGNHDKERTFYLGETLYAWFNNCQDVNINNSPKNRKYYQWGKNLLGFTHGDKEVKGALINLMATEEPIKWSQSIYREWHKGHLHHAKATAFQILDEHNGIREWILPSLVATDDWHAGKGYSALRESIAMVWNKELGKTDMFFYHPKED